MGGVKIVLKQKVENNNLVIELPTDSNKIPILDVLKKSNEKYGGYISIEMKPPYKPRTTGINSQNSLTWKLITIIAREMGEDTDYVENLVKIKATSKGYPYKTIEGQIVPASMTKINTVECSYLIDTCYEMCSFLGIVLEPDLAKERKPVFSMQEEQETVSVTDIVQQALSEASKKETEEEIHNADLFDGDIF